MTRARRRARVALHPHGLDLAPTGATPEILPLYAGTMHYWRHHPPEWGPGLDAMKAMGLRLLDTYVPWGVHELEEGVFDFGEKNPHLDVVKFLRMAEERGLKVVLRPGPHINGELTHFGLPDRVVWDRACQALTPKKNPVMLPMIPLAFPVPSYASSVFHQEVARWFEAVGEVLSPLRHPDGPIVLLQVDNEGALYFRDGPYDQDWHPDALGLYRNFLRAKYGSPKKLRDAYGQPALSFATVEPPVRFDATSADELCPHMDWMEFHEHLLATGMITMARALDQAGLGELPTMHNFPMGESATPLNSSRITEGIDLVSLDYYHPADPAAHMTVMRRTTELAVRCEGDDAPPYGAEVGAGFPPFFAPLDEEDSLYALMAAMAYGLRGFNLYMAVERDRWIGAPIDPHGSPRPFADRYHALTRALDKTQFHTLRRRAPVRLVVPRSLRRLARATHAFGPMTPALFNVLGGGFRESVLEDDFGLGTSATMGAEAFLRAFERALIARGVPFAYAGGEAFATSTKGAQWIVCATSGGVKPDLVAELRKAAAGGARVTIGPHVPDRDGSMRKLDVPLDVSGLEVETLDEITRADALVARRIEELALPTYAVDPEDVHIAVHEDALGIPRVAMVMNPTANEAHALVSIAGAKSLADAVATAAPRIARTRGAFEIVVPARTVRMLIIESG
jgi:beta-galactosidase